MSTEDPEVNKMSTDDEYLVSEVPADKVEPAVKDGEDSSDEDALQKEHNVLDRFPMRCTVINMGSFGEIYFNGVTSFVGFAILWGLSIWCMVDEDGSLEILKDWQAAVTEKFTWFYVVSNPIFTFFIVSDRKVRGQRLHESFFHSCAPNRLLFFCSKFYLAYRYGDIKLGKPDEDPEFSDQAYFMMLFSAGVAVGLFFYGASEPLYHRSDNWFAETGYRAQDEIDQWALVLTVCNYVVFFITSQRMNTQAFAPFFL